jgi:hypothetical protein
MDARRTIKDFTSPKLAVSFFESDYKNLLPQKYDTLVKSFEAIGYQREMTLLLVCDEARCLCEMSAADGSPIHDEFDA